LGAVGREWRMASSELGVDHASSIRYSLFAIRHSPMVHRSRDACAPEFCNGTGKKFRGAGSRQAFKPRWDRLSARSCSSAMRWVSLSLHPPYEESKEIKKEAERRQTRIQRPHHRMRRALESGARSPVGVPPRHLRQRPNATAQLQSRASWDGIRVERALPAPGRHPVQRAPRRPVIVPAGRFCPESPGSGGDEPPPAGTALAPPCRVTARRPCKRD
jgi:hypothetical protein